MQQAQQTHLKILPNTKNMDFEEFVSKFTDNQHIETCHEY